jgi:formylglycine-generating enzyme required for sulfatase activity
MNKFLSIFVFVFLCTAVLAQAPLKRPKRKAKAEKEQVVKPKKEKKSNNKTATKPVPKVRVDTVVIVESKTDTVYVERKSTNVPTARKQTAEDKTTLSNGQGFGKDKMASSGELDVPAVVIDGNTYTINGVSFEMIPVEGGTFRMGSYDGDSDEKPVHNVTLSDYAIGKTEVTQALWKAVMGSNPSYFKGDNLPVANVSWHDCQDFISKLNQLTGKQFRLPTEAEWEYAARGGNRSKGYKYSGNNDIDAVAWYEDNSGEKTHPVSTKHPNELGIYDMSGNVWEWCQDWYGEYSSSSETNPTGTSSGSDRVYRGGSWFIVAGRGRASLRHYATPVYRNYNLGLRLVLSQ